MMEILVQAFAGLNMISVMVLSILIGGAGILVLRSLGR
jgi:hypothetical protein